MTTWSFGLPKGRWLSAERDGFPPLLPPWTIKNRTLAYWAALRMNKLLLLTTRPSVTNNVEGRKLEVRVCCVMPFI